MRLPTFQHKTAKFCFLVLVASITLFIGYQLYVHEHVKTLTVMMLSSQLAQLKEMTRSYKPREPTHAGESISKIPPTSREEFSKRRKEVWNACKLILERNMTEPWSIHGIYTHPQSGFIYCSIAKAGRSFWKSVFFVLKHVQNPTAGSLFEMAHFQVHHDRSLEYKKTFSPKQLGYQSYPKRLLVVRNPFSRLLSTYLDKIYLPGYWNHRVMKIMLSRPIHDKNRTASVQRKDFLRQHFDIVASKFQPHFVAKNVKTSHKNKCGKYLTFSDFVKLGLDVDDPYLSSIYSSCNPCVFNFTHISYMETFTADAKAVLSHNRHEGPLGDLSLSAQVDKEMEMNIDFNYNKMFTWPDNGFHKTCMTAKELAYRLWHNFRWRGYIDPDVDYQIPSFSEVERVKSDLMFQIGRARESGLQNPERLKKTKQNFKEMAFRTLGKDLFDKVVNKYRVDVELFGYKDVRDKMYKLYDETVV